ncbi:MAG: HPr family phosphocarrier protein [Chloroflexi bacterium]|nr:HPr family phosphocarrier protein [Chloroflexota bacterium]
MKTVTLAIRNKVGLHARPAATFVRTVSRFQSAITVQNLTRCSPPVNAKSILLVLSLGVEKGHEIVVSAQGPDEAEVVAALQAAVESNFGEAE